MHPGFRAPRRPTRAGRLGALALLAALLIGGDARAGEFPKQVRVHRGTTPTLDGRLAPGEWDDAARITDFRTWMPQFSPIRSAGDLDATIWLKHDGRDLYVAFDVRDDLIYARDTERWLPPNNPQAHELTRQGWPWFGDGAELLVNARYEWSDADEQSNAGSGASWQMVASTHKSRLGGLGVGGLLEGEERSDEDAWNTYQRWILQGAMEAAVRVKDRTSDGSGFVIEWRVQADPCLEVESGTFWSPAMGEVPMGLNLAISDIDRPEDGEGNFGNFHHEHWWAGERDKRTWLKQWGTMILVPGPPPAAPPASPPGTIRLAPVDYLPLREVTVQVPERFREHVPEGLTVDLPEGFSAKVFAADGLAGPRQMALGPGGVVHVANMGAGGASRFRPPVDTDTVPPLEQRFGQIVALPDEDGDGVADTVRVVAGNLWWANSLAFHDGDLYVADTHEILRFRDGDGDGLFEDRQVLVPDIPTRGQHITRTLAIDSLAGKLYVSVGSTCDLCREEDPERATVLQFNLDGTGRRIYARGLRNAVGLTLQPGTGEVWITNNGHDREGRMLPPELITTIEDGGFYGWPLAYGHRVWIDFGIDAYRRAIFPVSPADSADVAAMQPPRALAPAHLAPMQIHFYRHEALGARFRDAAFVAFVGGSNANVIGHKVGVLFPGPDGRVSLADFLTGIQDRVADNDGTWARPVGVTSDRGGRLYVSSDDINELVLRIAPYSLDASFRRKPPVRVVGGARLLLDAVVEARGGAGGDPVRAVADLTAFGGPAEVRLEPEGPGLFRLRAEVDTLRAGRRPLVVRLSQTVGGERLSARLEHVVEVLHGADLVVAGERLAPGWTLEGDDTVRPLGFTGDGPPFRGAALALSAQDVTFRGWSLAFTPEVPQSAEGFTTLQLSLHPGTLQSQGPFLQLVVPPGRNIDLLRENLIDLEQDSWQTLELPLSSLELEGRPIEGFRLQGNLEGTFHLDELRLVSVGAREPGTAVVGVQSTPGDFALEANYPNPFNGGTTIPFRLAAAGDVELAVYNLAGQRVAEVAVGPHAAGAHVAHWDGRDAAGRRLATGLYLYRLRAAGEVRVRKLLLLR